MRLWRDLSGEGIAVESIDDGDPLTPPVFLEFRCPGCDEFHSVSCDCRSDHSVDFFCACVPSTCPTCRHELHDLGRPLREEETRDEGTEDDPGVTIELDASIDLRV